jgi:hypothetical protein
MEAFRTQKQKAIRWINLNGHVLWKPKGLKKKPGVEGRRKEISYMKNVFIAHLSPNCATHRFYSFACNTNLDVLLAEPPGSTHNRSLGQMTLTLLKMD